MNFNIPPFRHCLPSAAQQWSFTSRCLAMDVIYVTIFIELLSYICIYLSVLKSSIFWNITPCSPLKINRRSRRNMPPPSGLKNKSSRKVAWSRWQALRHVPPKHQLIFNWLHGVISQKIEFFISTAVRTSNPILVHRNPCQRRFRSPWIKRRRVTGDWIIDKNIRRWQTDWNGSR
jgi:hypothetical protein